jgi:aspartyl-tRNA(Asn)/glutamyl-tRNA(Gln) amidotransferase subunit C
MDAIDRAAALARIRLSEDEKSKAAADLEEMLKYFEILKKADINETAGDEESVKTDELREDKAVAGDMSAAIISAAPQSENGMFVVPETI